MSKLLFLRHCGRALPTLLCLIALSAAANAAEYYVAPAASGGDDQNLGTEAQPFASITRGQQAAAPGDTVWIRGGEYVFSGNTATGVVFDKSGQQDNRINYWAYPGETPVFDFFEMTPMERLRGFSITGSWLHFRGLELRGIQQTVVDANESWCIRVEGGSNNIFEFLDLHHNEGPGLFIADGGNNLVLNVDSHHNYDPDRGGENSDGFGCHSNEDGNVFRGCRAWYNSDDGFDFINSPGVCTVEYSWAWLNGYQPDSNTVAGNGAGIKAGGFTNNIPATIPRHVIRFNVTWSNRRQGFYANHHEGGIDWINNTAFDNGQRNFDMLADEGPAPHLLRNNLAFGSGGTIDQVNENEVDDAFNSWNAGVSVSADDFASTDSQGADGPRQADGSLPALDFMRLREGSDLIDAGEDQGLPFNGAAPDLGAFEFGDPLPEPTTTGTNTSGGATSMGTDATVTVTSTSAVTGTSGGGAMGTTVDGSASASSPTSGGMTMVTSATGSGGASAVATTVGMGGTTGTTNAESGALGSDSTTGSAAPVLASADDSGCSCAVIGQGRTGHGRLWFLMALGTLFGMVRRSWPSTTLLATRRPSEQSGE